MDPSPQSERRRDTFLCPSIHIHTLFNEISFNVGGRHSFNNPLGPYESIKASFAIAMEVAKSLKQV